MSIHDPAQLTLRIPREYIDRTEALIPLIEGRPEGADFRILSGGLKRANIARMIYRRGLEALEAENAKPGSASTDDADPFAGGEP